MPGHEHATAEPATTPSRSAFVARRQRSSTAIRSAAGRSVHHLGVGRPRPDRRASPALRPRSPPRRARSSGRYLHHALGSRSRRARARSAGAYPIATRSCPAATSGSSRDRRLRLDRLVQRREVVAQELDAALVVRALVKTAPFSVIRIVGRRIVAQAQIAQDVGRRSPIRGPRCGCQSCLGARPRRTPPRLRAPARTTRRA